MSDLLYVIEESVVVNSIIELKSDLFSEDYWIVVFHLFILFIFKESTDIYIYILV